MPSHPPASATDRFALRWWYWSGITMVFAWAAWLRFRLPLDPFANPDTWTYLSPGLRKLIAAEFAHLPYGRSFVYPGFLYLLLRFFQDFRAITVVQHLLGLLAGGLLLLTWRRVRVFMRDPLVGPAAYNALGLVAAAAFLLSSAPIWFEAQLRPEALCVFLVSVNLYTVIQFSACCFIENRQTAAVAYGIAAVFSSGLIGDVKPSFFVVAIVALLPVTIFFFRRGWFWQKTALGFGAIMSAALLLLPEHILSRNDEWSRTFLPTTLFVIHAGLIRDQIRDDLEHNAKLPYSREWLAHVQSALAAEIAKSGVHYSTLGLNPDYLMYNRSSIVAQLRNEFGNDNVSALCAFYWFYYWRIWLHRPFLVIKKIVRQMAIFYAPMCPAYDRGRAWTLAKEYHRGVASLDDEAQRKVWEAYLPAVRYMTRADTLARSTPIVQHPAVIRIGLTVLASTYLALFLAALTLSAAALMQKRHRRRLGWLGALVLFVYSYSLANCFEVAVIHTLQNPRYVTVQVFFTILAQFLALWFILEFIFGMRALTRMPLLDAH